MKRELTFGFSLSEELRRKLSKSETRREKGVLLKLVKGQLMRKYKLVNKAKQEIVKAQTMPINIENVSSSLKGESEYQRTRKETARKVRVFFTSDENSTASAGKKETLTKGKQKMQKRFMNDSMINLHAKFKAQHPEEVIQYTRYLYSPIYA